MFKELSEQMYGIAKQIEEDFVSYMKASKTGSIIIDPEYIPIEFFGMDAETIGSVVKLIRVDNHLEFVTESSDEQYKSSDTPFYCELMSDLAKHLGGKMEDEVNTFISEEVDNIIEFIEEQDEDIDLSLYATAHIENDEVDKVINFHIESVGLDYGDLICYPDYYSCTGEQSIKFDQLALSSKLELIEEMSKIIKNYIIK